MTQPTSYVVSNDGWTSQSHKEICAQSPSPTNWVVRDLIEAESGPVLLFGQPGAFKSWIAMHVGYCVATGDSVFGKYPVQTRTVHYINIDTGAAAFKRRLRLLRPPMDNFLVYNPERFDANAFEEVLRAAGGGFVIVDCFADIYEQSPGVEQGSDMRRFAHELRQCFIANNLSGIVVDHAKRDAGFGRGDQYYGSVQKAAVFRQMWSVSPLKHRKRIPGEAHVTLRCEKMSEEESFPPLTIALDWTRTSFNAVYEKLDISAANEDSETEARNKVILALDGSPDGLKRTEICKITGLTKEQVLAAVKGPEIKCVKGGRSTRYQLDAPTTAALARPYS